MATPDEVPIRVAPALIKALAASSVRAPPDALTPIIGPTASRISSISSMVAPPVENPVDDFVKTSTGFSTGPHLHLEWWHNGQYVDPMGLW